MGERSHWTVDPLVDTAAHRLNLHPDYAATAAVGLPQLFGACSCGEWVTTSCEPADVTAEFDEHMTLIQGSAHCRAFQEPR